MDQFFCWIVGGDGGMAIGDRGVYDFLPKYNIYMDDNIDVERHGVAYYDNIYYSDGHECDHNIPQHNIIGINDNAITVTVSAEEFEYVLPLPPPDENSLTRRSSIQDVDEDVDGILFHNLEILSAYLTGQKHIFLFSKRVMSFKQNSILLLALVIGVIDTILSIRECQEYSLLIVTVLNSFITLLIGILGIFKFDVKGESYSHVSNAYNKLEMYVENATSKMESIVDLEQKKIFYFNQIHYVEEAIGNLRDDANYAIPSVVTLIYPILTKIKIFKFILLYNHSQYRDSLSHDIEENRSIGTDMLKALEEELYIEINNADKLRHFWYFYTLFPPKPRELYEEFIRYKLF